MSFENRLSSAVSGDLRRLRWLSLDCIEAGAADGADDVTPGIFESGGCEDDGGGLLCSSDEDIAWSCGESAGADE